MAGDAVQFLHQLPPPRCLLLQLTFRRALTMSECAARNWLSLEEFRLPLQLQPGICICLALVFDPQRVFTRVQLERLAVDLLAIQKNRRLSGEGVFPAPCDAQNAVPLRREAGLQL